MAFILFVIITLITLIIVFGLIGEGLLNYKHLQFVKKSWPSLTTIDLINRHQYIFDYRMKLSIKNVYQYYANLITYGIMLITLGISIGGYLIADVNLALIPIITLCLELSFYFFINTNLIKQKNDDYKQYSRTHLDNEIKIIIIPDSFIKAVRIIRRILVLAFFFDAISLYGVLVLLNHMN